MKPGITQLTRMCWRRQLVGEHLENRISADFAGPVQEDRNGGLSVMIRSGRHIDDPATARAIIIGTIR